MHLRQSQRYENPVKFDIKLHSNWFRIIHIVWFHFQVSLSFILSVCICNFALLSLKITIVNIHLPNITSLIFDIEVNEQLLHLKVVVCIEELKHEKKESILFYEFFMFHSRLLKIRYSISITSAVYGIVVCWVKIAEKW